MKKILLMICISMLFLTACSTAEKGAPVSPDEPIDITGEKTVLYCGDEEFPISFTVDGVQKIENGVYWFYELSNSYARNWDELFYTYDEKSLELNGSRKYGEFKNEKCFVTNGSWALFLTPNHTEYDASTQNDVEEILVDLSGKQLQENKMTDLPVVITDVWDCDLDGDGNQERFFKARYEHSGESGYCFLGYLKGDSCQVLCGFFGETDIPEMRPMVCDFEGDGNWSVLIEKKGDYNSFSVFAFENGNFIPCYEVIF